jgi:predicted DNA-binding ArsR family transcriptional regulator
MPELTQLQRDVLEQCSTTWLRPMDMGGRDGSHHTSVLKALVRKGLVERQRRIGSIGARGSYRYRLTAAGDAELRRAAGGSE